jgi:sulfur dioxygenase
VTSACPLKNKYPNAKIVLGIENTSAEACADIMAGEGHVLPIGKHEITAIETPGHTIGCMSFLVDNKLFTGDSLFIRSTGRCDFQGGSASTLYHSIQKLFSLPDSTIVYPGHDYNGFTVSTIGEEKKFNTLVREDYDQQTFIKKVGSLDLSLPKKINVAVPANQSCGLISS